MAPWATADDNDSAFALGMAIIGNGIRTGRRRSHLTQQQLGWLVGVSQSAISRLETGTIQGLRLRTLGRIVGQLETRSDYLFPAGPPPRPWEQSPARPSPVDDSKDPGLEYDADGHADVERDVDARIWS